MVLVGTVFSSSVSQSLSLPRARTSGKAETYAWVTVPMLEQLSHLERAKAGFTAIFTRLANGRNAIKERVVSRDFNHPRPRGLLPGHSLTVRDWKQ